uniref:ras-like protein 1 n=1 Tax=Ciona intestinalis TaxID=7719 RepID=UPI000180C8E8|nr:ras-like protein 1 [Ciona intestinalis]|eukprot:XP_026693245.1 ras-like protein 1 [Ciona intestinalis]
MQSTPFRRLRKQNSSVSGRSHRFRVAVFGQAGVGKTAFNVRFVTKRFIGEYDPTLESIYQRAYIVPPNYPVFYEIMDTPGQEENNSVMLEKIKWADAFVIVYSITDRQSFAEIPRLKFLVSHTISNNGQKNTPIVIVGNKNDLSRDRMVSRSEGEKLALELGCSFYEISVRESIDEIAFIFEQLYRSFRQVEPTLLNKGKNEKSTVDLPIIPHVFPSLPAKKRIKSYKHIDKIRRLQGSTNLSVSSNQVSYPSRPTSSSFSHNHRQPYLCTTLEEELYQTDTQESDEQPVDVADEQVSEPKPDLPQEAFGTETEDIESSTCSSKEDEELSKVGSSDPGESGAEYQPVDARRAAEEFAKKIILLNIG